MEEYNDKYEFLYIKVPYFSEKIEFRAKLLLELNRIFEKNHIITNSLTNLIKYFNVDFGSGINKFLELLIKIIEDKNKDDYSEIIKNIKNIKNNLDYLPKKIILILDDFDRVERNEQIIEVLNFIGELNVELSEKITLLTLSSYNKLEKLVSKIGEGEEKSENHNNEKYLDKYFDKIFELNKIIPFQFIDFISENYDLDLTLKEILLNFKNIIEDNLRNRGVSLRSIERLIKNLREINVEEEIYRKIFVAIEIIIVLFPDIWEKIKEIEINKESIEEKEDYEIIKAFIISLIYEENLKKLKNNIKILKNKYISCLMLLKILKS